MRTLYFAAVVSIFLSSSFFFFLRHKNPHLRTIAQLCRAISSQLRHVSTNNRFTALFPGSPGWAGARRELLDFMVQGKINRGRHTDRLAGRHSIQTNQCQPPPSPRIFLQAGCPSCRPTNSAKALKAQSIHCQYYINFQVIGLSFWFRWDIRILTVFWLQHVICHICALNTSVCECSLGICNLNI